MDDGTTLPERFAAEHLLAHAGWVRVMAGHLLADPSAADDLAQESLLRALRGRPADPERPRGWLTAIVRNTLRGTQREGERRAAREQQVAAREALPSAADLAARASVHRAVVDAVLALPEPYRATLLLRFFEEIETSEIARRRGEPVETVRTRLKRGLAQLRERLGRELNVETASGGRHRGLAALVLVAEPAGTAGAAAVGASTVAAGIGGVAAMAIGGKTVATVAIVAAAAWWAWPRHDAPTDRAVGEPAVARGSTAVAADEPVSAIRSETAVEPEPAGAALSSVAVDATPRLSPLMERMRAELTHANLGANNVVDDLGPEIRAALQGLLLETLDLEALIAYLESREESSWVVRDSLQLATNGRERTTTWAQAYENSKSTCSFCAVVVSEEEKRSGVSFQIYVGSWGSEFDRELGPSINPLLWFHAGLRPDGSLDGRLQVNLQERVGQIIPASPAEPGSQMAKFIEEMKQRAEVAKQRMPELIEADALPRYARWHVDANRRELAYYRQGPLLDSDPKSAFRSSRSLTDGEIAALRRLVERYQELAKEHAAGLGEKPASAK